MRARGYRKGMNSLLTRLLSRSANDKDDSSAIGVRSMQAGLPRCHRQCGFQRTHVLQRAVVHRIFPCPHARHLFSENSRFLRNFRKIFLKIRLTGFFLFDSLFYRCFYSLQEVKNETNQQK